MRRIMVLALAGLLASAMAVADPPAGKGKDKDTGKDRPVVEQPVYPASGSGKDGPSGKVVSGCAQQANELGVKGQDRQAFMERCQRRGGDTWSSADFGSHCRERAEKLGLRGDDKDRFVRKCREYRDDEAVNPRKH